MGLKKGMTNNVNGRPKGTPNKTTGDVRKMLSSFIGEKLETAMNDFDNLDTKDRFDIISKLLPYVAPKLQSTAIDFRFEAMTDQELDHIIESLKQSSNGQD